MSPKRDYGTTDYGNGITGPSRGEVAKAVEGIGDKVDDFTVMKPLLRPVFIRKRPLPPGVDRPLTKAAGVVGEVALGCDIGPAFMYVGPSMLEVWGVTFDEAYDLGLANLRAAVEDERYFEMEYEKFDGMDTWFYQSKGGLASGLLLLEDELTKRFGPEPRIITAPMRNLVLSMPADADMELVRWLRDEIANEDPNGLALPIFTLIEGKLSPAPWSPKSVN